MHIYCPSICNRYEIKDVLEMKYRIRKPRSGWRLLCFGLGPRDNLQPQRDGSSSLPSWQSRPPSHFCQAGMHRPLAHLKFTPPQLSPHVSVVSSLPSVHWGYPLHFQEAWMHCPSEQANPPPLTSSQLAPHVSVVSSLPSSQSLYPSHFLESWMPVPVGQLAHLKPCT